MNYNDIGKQIRSIRKSKNMSQEALAEKVNISTTHMSHIETANAKYSMDVFFKIADALSVSPSVLLSDKPRADKSAFTNEILDVLNSCTYQEALMLLEIMKSVKKSFEKFKNIPDGTKQL